jgi:ABC-type multidrug transport system fused ATPase/permease subunit
MPTFRKLLALLEPAQLRAAFTLLALMLVGMVLETLSVGLIIPVLAIITAPGAVSRYPLLNDTMAQLGNPSSERMIVIVMSMLLVVYVLKAGFLAYLSWQQAHFVFDIESGLSRRLYAGYLRQPYTFHMQRNSALLIRNVTTGVGQFAGAIMATNMLASEILVLIGIVGLLLYAEPLGALLVGGALTLAAYSFHHFTKDRILRWGGARQYHEGQRIQRLQQGLGGVREVKMLGIEAEVVSQYDEHNASNARVGRRQSVVTALPRLWLELLAILGLTGLVLSMVYQGKPLEAVVPTLGLFAAAAFRLLPSVNKVLTSMQNLRYNLPVIDTLYAEKHILDDTAKSFAGTGQQMHFEQWLELQHVSYAYPGTPVEVLSDVSLSIPYGSSVGFIGSSGAGKSTLISVILGLLTPTSGRVVADEVDIQTNLRAWQNQIGYVPQSVFLVDDTLRRNVAFGLPDEQIDDLAVQRAINAAQLAQFVASLPAGLDTEVGERGVRLSGGQCQRIGIARALYHDPPVLVLDEASSSLDMATEEAVMESVKNLRHSKTVLIIAHRLTTVANCDELYEVVRGQVTKVDAEAKTTLNYPTTINREG